MVLAELNIAQTIWIDQIWIAENMETPFLKNFIVRNQSAEEM